MSHPSIAQRIHPQTQATPGRGRWLALLLLCAADGFVAAFVTAGVAAAAAALASLLLVPAGKSATDTPRFMH